MFFLACTKEMRKMDTKFPRKEMIYEKCIIKCNTPCSSMYSQSHNIKSIVFPHSSVSSHLPYLQLKFIFLKTRSLASSIVRLGFFFRMIKTNANFHCIQATTPVVSFPPATTNINVFYHP